MAITQATSLADFSTGIGTAGAVLQVDNVDGQVGIGTTDPQGTLQVGIAITMDGTAGVITASSFSGSGGNLSFTGADISAATASFTGNVSVGGTLTYEDVTNVDSVGVITARSGVRVTGGNIQAGDSSTGFSGTVISGFSTTTSGNAGTIQAKNFGSGGANFVGFDAAGNDTARILADGGALFASDVSIADKIIHTGDTNTAIRFPAADTFTVETSGSERLRVDSGGRLIVGADSAPSIVSQVRLIVSGESLPNSSTVQVRYDDTTAGPAAVFANARGSTSSPAILQSGDEVGKIRFYGHDGNDFDNYAAQITAAVDGTPGSNDMPGRLVFSTTADGAASPTEALRIDSDQIVSVNNPNAIYSSSDNFVVHNSDAGPRIGFQRQDTGQVTSGEELGALSFYSNDGDLNPSARMLVEADDAHASGDKPGRIIFQTVPDGSATLTERLRITSGGMIRIPVNATATSGKLQLGASQQLSIYQDSSNGYIANNDFIIANGDVSETLARFRNGGAVDLHHNNSKKFETTSSGVTVTGTVSDSIGNLRSLVKNSQNGGSTYTLVAGDAGKIIDKSNGGGVTVPNGVLSAGDMVTILNNSGSDFTITQGSSFSLYNTSDASTGNKTLAGRGIATIYFLDGGNGYISGSGMS